MVWEGEGRVQEPGSPAGLGMQWLRASNRSAVAFVSMFGLSGCGETDLVVANSNPTEIPEELTLAIEPSPVSVTVGSFVQLMALVSDGSGASQDVTQLVSWTSDAPNTARVSATGILEGLAAGSAGITAQGSGLSAQTTATVNAVPAAQPASVVVTPPSVLLRNVGETTQLTASARDSGGNTLPGVSLQWVSDNATVATIASDLLVTARDFGTARIVVTAPCCNLSDTTLVTVRPVGPQVEGGPNEPPDYLPIVGREFNTFAASNNDEGTGSFPWRTGGSEGWDDHESTESNLFLSTDPSSPLSPPGVMTFRYPAQTVTPGTSFSPGQVQTKNFQGSGAGLNTPLALQEIYDRWTFKIESNFQVNDNSGFTKMVFYRGFFDGRLVNGPYIKFGQSQGDFSLEWDLQGTEDNARILAETGDNTIGTGIWYEVEVRLVLNSAPGVADGEVHTWLLEHPGGTRQKIFEYTDVRLRGAGDVNSTGFFSSVRHDPVWGGQGGTIDSTFLWHLGHHWTSGKE